MMPIHIDYSAWENFAESPGITQKLLIVQIGSLAYGGHTYLIYLTRKMSVAETGVKYD